jgi:uncharacterized protein YndB with AHSA1/START domain
MERKNGLGAGERELAQGNNKQRRQGMNNDSSTTLTMVRTFLVSPEKVFDAWLNPNMMRKWLFTLEGTNKESRNEPRVGGGWETMDHCNGTDYRAIGEYLEIDPPAEISVQMP